MPLKFLASQKKGGKILVNNGFMYHLHNEGANKFNCRCILYKGTYRGICHTSTNTRRGVVLKETAHNHAPDVGHVEAKAIRAKMRKTVQRSQEPTSAIISSGVAGVSTSAAAHLPSVDSLKRSTRRLRAACNPVPPNPSSLSDLEIRDSYRLSVKGENFLMYDSAVDHGILIFTKQKNTYVQNSAEPFRSVVHDPWTCRQ